jgi:D-beta-D-heptose 7-phosphate kinase/D-beta-D-heptose 1-phosphate adenosyltransferase
MSEKIQTTSSISPILAARRARGERLVFTNGCFDLLHVGHTRYLQAARVLGDCLIVGLNSDASVRAIKPQGRPSRPIVPQAQRAEVLAALACVDYVVLFDEPEPSALIAAIQPDVLVKGGDWPLDQIVGRDLVQARGGRVVTIPLVPDVSTTALVQRIQQLT